ncbi:ATP-binding protein [Halorientalis pallida]|uniref:ATP-binding protein n=1 Tax=Halorientalis pallida TaxID=2479928 RepID=A0A498KVU0_9EURY|nr:ATP-binding protein [Halorientalis pallida]RXK48638.1 ATP-binding protein [Halorientalis pallida]
MTGQEFVVGRGQDLDAGPSGRLGAYRALDGSEGAPLYLDLDGPHAVLIVGKRGYGKSYTLGVVAESLARARGVAPVIVDPMDVFTTLDQPTRGDADPVPADVIEDPAVTPSALDSRSWCALLGLPPESGAGGLVWQAAGEADTLDGMRTVIDAVDASNTDKRAAINHVDMAEAWGVFDADGLTAQDLAGPEITVVNVAGMDTDPMNAVVRGIGEALYQARETETVDRLPWLLLDEAHTFFQGVAGSALSTILTRGRAPGVSLVVATQRPSAVPEVGISQSDVLLSHRLTSEADLDALQAAQPTYVNSSLADEDRMPTDTGEVVIVDDSTESVHAAQVRRRDTPHGGDSPSASDVVAED